MLRSALSVAWRIQNVKLSVCKWIYSLIGMNYAELVAPSFVLLTFETESSWFAINVYVPRKVPHITYQFIMRTFVSCSASLWRRIVHQKCIIIFRNPSQLRSSCILNYQRSQAKANLLQKIITIPEIISIQHRFSRKRERETHESPWPSCCSCIVISIRYFAICFPMKILTS